MTQRASSPIAWTPVGLSTLSRLKHASNTVTTATIIIITSSCSSSTITTGNQTNHKEQTPSCEDASIEQACGGIMSNIQRRNVSFVRQLRQDRVQRIATLFHL